MESGQRKIIILAIILVATLAIAGWYRFAIHMTPEDMTPEDVTTDKVQEEQAGEAVERAFSRDRLNTNTSKRSIDLKLVLDGGPGKDGIPALNDPKFYSIQQAADDLRDESRGLVVTVGSTTRFYPYGILNWHEIANDTLEGKPLTVTFCPLCGSAIVFDATVNGQVLRFGVSGKLFESNLLMYDRTTESLWSQSRGEAVIGDMLGTKLTIFPSQVLTFAQFREQYPDAQVLSRETGHRRSYDLDPYSGYGDTDSILFPVSVQDRRFPVKEIFFIVNFSGKSVAFKLRDLTEEVTATVDVDGTTLTATSTKGIISVTAPGDTEPIPGYHEMWFSWATHHQEDGVVWSAGN